VGSPAGSPRIAAVMRVSPGELGEELGVGVGLAEAVEEHVDGLLAVPAVEGPAQGAVGFQKSAVLVTWVNEATA
jgi:hypothetical protein